MVALPISSQKVMHLSSPFPNVFLCFCLPCHPNSGCVLPDTELPVVLVLMNAECLVLSEGRASPLQMLGALPFVAAESYLFSHPVHITLAC